MAVGTEVVQVIKQEDASLGGDGGDAVEWGQTPINPQEDAIECCGVYFCDGSNRDKFVYAARNGNDLILRDQYNTTPITLSEIRPSFARHFLLMGV